MMNLLFNRYFALAMLVLVGCCDSFDSYELNKIDHYSSIEINNENIL
jgi:hypothetical protein